MESVAQQVIVQVEKLGIKFYGSQGGDQLEIFTDLQLAEPKDAKFSPIDGKHVAVQTVEGITILDMDKKEVSGELKIEDTSVINFSPKGTYLVVCTRHTEGKPNLFILNTSAEIIAEHTWTSISREGCENVTWTNDELYMARKDAKSSKNLYVYEVKESLQNEFGIITLDKITSFAFSPHGDDETKPYFLLVGSAGENASMTRFYQMKTCEKEKFKNLSKDGQEMNYVFAPNGHAVVVWTQNVVDKTGQSYYGNHDLRYVQLGGGNKRSKVAVFDNQVHDVVWSPDSEDFTVISGKQPAVCTMYTKNCIPTFEFGRIHANTIKYNPFSNLLLLGGFGNLVGDIQFWNKDTLKLIGKNKAHCTVSCEWSSDGAQVMTAVLNPRVRVDNEVKQFNHKGKRLQHREIASDNELYAAHWRPQPLSNFTKIELDASETEYSVENDPDEVRGKSKPAALNKPKGNFTIPRSTAFSAMMRTEMNAATLQGPRKLKKDDYKEYMIETAEEKKAMQAKPAAKKSAPKTSWRNAGGFNIPSKADQEKQTAEYEEEKKLIPAPQEYKAPVKQQQNQAQNAQNQGQGQGKKKRNRNKKNKNKQTQEQTPVEKSGGQASRGRGGRGGRGAHATRGAHGASGSNGGPQYDNYYDAPPNDFYNNDYY